MNRIRLRTGAVPLCLAIALLLSAYLSCDLLPAEDEDEAELEGSWLAFPAAPYAYDEGSTADALLFEFSGSAHKLVFYSDTAQVGGTRGTFSVSDGVITFATTQDWSDTDFWVASSGSFSMPYTCDGSTLVIDGPDGKATLIKRTFARPASLVGAWFDMDTGNAHVTLNADGTYAYDDPEPYAETGTWDAIPSHLRSETVTMEGVPGVKGSLTAYALEGGALTLVYPAPTGAVQFTK